jgi:hypothetical protein
MEKTEYSASPDLELLEITNVKGRETALKYITKL